MEWRLKGTAGMFSTLSSKENYKTVLEVRNAVKKAIGIPEDGILDIVLYRNSNPHKPLSDLERVSVPEKFLVSRMSSAQANQILMEAAKDFSGDEQSPDQSPSTNDDVTVLTTNLSANLSEQKFDKNDTNNNLNGTSFVNDDEDVKIASAMAAGGMDIQDTLQRRYYRNKTLQDPVKSQQKMNQLQPEDKSTYICHMCGNPGHNIKDCTIVDGRRCEKKIRSATGIPVNFLRSIRQDEIQNYKEVYILKGMIAVLVN